MNVKKITANEGYTFKRIHDGVVMGEEIYLGYDWSTGMKREDKEEYYEQIPIEEVVEDEVDSPEDEPVVP